MEQNTHLNEKAAYIAQQSKEERINSLEQPVWIPYTRARKLIEQINRYMNMPKSSRINNLLIIGESNMGKTSIIEHFVDSHPKSTHENEHGISQVHIPVVMIQAPSTADEKNLYAEILNQFWTAYRPTDTTIKLRHQMLYLMRECNVRLLIIDEVHNLLETTAVKQRQIMNALKNLGNELKIPIIAVGIESASTILSHDPQLTSRYDSIRLAPWKLDREFLGLLKGFEARLPLRKPSMLYSREKATLLLHICDGNLGNLHRLLRECARYAIETETEEITVEIIKRFKWIRPAKKHNPVEIPL